MLVFPLTKVNVTSLFIISRGRDIKAAYPFSDMVPIIVQSGSASLLSSLSLKENNLHSRNLLVL